MSLDLPHGRSFNESTLSLPATVVSSSSPRNQHTLVMNGDVINPREPADYMSLNGNFGFDARKELKRRHAEKSDQEPLTDMSHFVENCSPKTDGVKKRNRLFDHFAGDDGERVPLITTNGCHERAIGEEENGDDEGMDHVL